MVSTGMAAAGYEYINIDAGYLTHERDAVSKKLVVNPAKFPSGMRHVSDYIHSKGLKVGTTRYDSVRIVRPYWRSATTYSSSVGLHTGELVGYCSTSPLGVGSVLSRPLLQCLLRFIVPFC